MSKPIKEMVIDVLQRRISGRSDFLVVDSSRMDAVTTNRFRLALREKEISLLAVKNSLAKKALHGVGISALDPILEGPSALIWGGEDIVSLSKEITKWTKQIEQLVVKGGASEGTTLTAADVRALSKSPGRQELIGRIVMLVLSPGACLVGALLGPGGRLAGQIKSLAETEPELAASETSE